MAAYGSQPNSTQSACVYPMEKVHLVVTRDMERDVRYFYSALVSRYSATGQLSRMRPFCFAPVSDI